MGTRLLDSPDGLVTGLPNVLAIRDSTRANAPIAVIRYDCWMSSDTRALHAGCADLNARRIVYARTHSPRLIMKFARAEDSAW